MKNDQVPIIANLIEKELGIEAFCDWFSPGEEADDKWREFEKLRGRSFKQSFYGPHTENVFAFDKKHLDRTDGVLLVMPGGKSAHLELGYTVGKGKPAFILFDKEPDRYDIMLRFVNDIYMSKEEMIDGLEHYIQRETYIGEVDAGY